jgi:hypothetical protein
MCPHYLEVLLWLGFVAFAAGGCSSSHASPPGENCPAPDDYAFINLGCAPVEPPVVKTTGPCTASAAHFVVAAQDAQNIMLISNDAGTCHVEITLGNGATSSVDVEFMSVSRAFGCGQEFVPITADGNDLISVAAPVCDAGLDAEPSD